MPSTNIQSGTPYRKTTAQFDLPEYTQNRPALNEHRVAEQIGRGGTASNTTYYAGVGWGLKAHQVSQWHEKAATNAGVLRLPDWNVAAHITEKPHFSTPSLPGVTPGGGMISSGNWFLHKSVKAGDSWAQSVPTGTTFPTTDSADIPMAHVAASKQHYPENQAYSFRWRVNHTDANRSDNLIAFEFGGNAQVSSLATTGSTGTTVDPNSAGGKFMLIAKGNGRADLHEWFNNAWKKISEFAYSSEHAVGDFFHELIICGDPQHKSLSVLAASAPRDNKNRPSLLTARIDRPRDSQPVHIVPPAKHGQPKLAKKTAIGAGPVAVWLRQDHKIYFQVSTLQYPSSGTVTDDSLFVRIPLPAGTTFTVKPDATIPTGCTVSYKIYNAQTNVELPQDGSGNYQTVSGQAGVYLTWTFTTTNPKLTPYLRSYEITLPGASALRNPTPFTSPIVSAEIMGGDEDPTHEMGHMVINDPANKCPRLKRQGRIQNQIITTYDPNDQDKYSILGKFELLECDAIRTGGKHNLNYPVNFWNQYDCKLIGLHSLVNQHVSLMMKDWSVDPYGAVDTDGQPLPWKLTDIIRWCFNEAGFPDNTLDIPDSPARLFASGNGDQELMLQPLANLWEAVMHFSRDYLNAFILYDANAGTYGKFRLRFAPQAPYTILANFYTDPAAASAGKWYTMPGAIPNASSAPSYYITHYRTKACKPENNYVCITASGEFLPSGDPSVQLQFAYNPKSYNFDPTQTTADPLDPSYLGSFTPVIYYDMTLKDNQEGLNFLTRRLYDLTCKPKNRVYFRAPVALIESTVTGDSQQTHARKLHYYDAIKVNGVTCLIESLSNLTISEEGQFADYQCLALTPPD